MARPKVIVLCVLSVLCFCVPTVVLSAELEEGKNEAEISEKMDEEDLDMRSDGWSLWSDWSTCSRSCNGGVTYQLRKCEKKTGCVGEASKYRICNMQACLESQDFRAVQCAAYNIVPYRGRLYEWLPYPDPEDPCGLTCYAKGFGFVAKLASAVKDGTRCREGSLDMCVGGKCLAVGCDLQLGSEKKVDECGVCGGDGSTCRRPVYVWNKTPFSSCSVSCGGGYQMSRPTCLNKATEKEVDERLCDVTLRPRPQIKECNTHKCPPVWVTDSWSPCSASCNGGRQSRQVHCAQISDNGIRVPVTMQLCTKQKPLTERSCNTMPCPQWISGPWSGCSVTCGKGQKTRSVACRDAKGQHSEDCDVDVMPDTKMDCDSGLICTPSEDPGTYLFSDIFKESQDAPPPPYQSLPWEQKVSPVSTEPSYVAGDWGPCNVTCGQGIRKRKVDCKIFLEFSRTVAKLPDKECPGPRPPDIENCYPRPCSLDQNKLNDRKSHKSHHMGIEVTYSWKANGFTPCSASCLGGTKESIIVCVRDHDQAIVKASQCNIKEKPDAITQTCNDHPCPPKWNVSEYTPCTKQCGGGIQTRLVNCLHEVTRGAANTLIVPNDQCPQPPPRNKQFCNVFDCPSRWKTEPWSKCSKSCAGGEKSRKIRCMRELAFGQVVELSPSSCTKRRPKTQKVCNVKSCPDFEDSQGPQIIPSHQMYVQDHPQKRVYLKVGGRAIVFAGTNLKIRCPSRKSHNKTNILWYKDDEKILQSKRISVSLKGALKIRRIAFKDGGKYTCVSGHSKADMHISVKHLPPGQGRSQEDRTVERPSVFLPKQKSESEFSHEKFHTPSSAKNKNHISPYQPKSNTKFYDKDGKGDTSFEDTVNHSEMHYNQKNYAAKNSSFKTGVSKANSANNKLDLSTLDRVPLYVLAASDKNKTNQTTNSTIKNGGAPVESEELVPHRTDSDRDKNRLKSETNADTEDSDLPPRVIDTWEQRYDGSRRRNKVKPYDTWERNHGGALFSDQESGELNVGTPHGGKGFPGGNRAASSGASSNHGNSHIQKLLVNLRHTLGGRHYTAYEDDNENVVSEEIDEDSPTKLMANSFVFGKGRAENLEFDWVITDWSPCSQSCGGNGFQVRASQCLVRLNNVSKTVDSGLCEDAGLAPPATVQSCGTEDCPHWETAPWSQCLESHCFTWHSSYQKRDIFCRTSNGTDVPLHHCDERTRPRRKRECYNERCRSTWKVGEWSQCMASCSRQGFQSRILQCVWFGSMKPAGNACRDQPRPSVMRPCTGPPCQSSENQLH